MYELSELQFLDFKVIQSWGNVSFNGTGKQTSSSWHSRTWAIAEAVNVVIAPLELASPVLGWVAMCVCASIPFLCGPTSHPLSWNTMEGVSIFQPAAGLRNSEHEGREPAVLLKAGSQHKPGWIHQRPPGNSESSPESMGNESEGLGQPWHWQTLLLTDLSGLPGPVGGVAWMTQ